MALITAACDGILFGEMMNKNSGISEPREEPEPLNALCDAVIITLGGNVNE